MVSVHVTGVEEPLLREGVALQQQPTVGEGAAGVVGVRCRVGEGQEGQGEAAGEQEGHHK